MSLRSLGYLLTRRFSQGHISRARAKPSAWIVSQAASVPADGWPRYLHRIRDHGFGGSYYGAAAAAAAAFAGVAGVLFFKEHTDDDHADGKSSQEITNIMDMDKQKQDMNMEAMFDEWMELIGRTYPTQEEKAKRFEIFKKTVEYLESRNPPLSKFTSGPCLPNQFADRTEEELRAMRRRRGRSINTEQYRKEKEAMLRKMEELKQKMKEKEGK